MTAMRLCLERILPPKRDRSVRFRVPIPVSAADACESLAAITTAVARGELTPAEAAALAGVVEKYVKALEAAEFERRLQVLEQADLRKAQPRGGSR
jgi:hypothetical protein